MPAKPPAGLEELSIDEREVMLETIARICAGVFSDLVRLKNPSADHTPKRRVRRVREEGAA